MQLSKTLQSCCNTPLPGNKRCCSQCRLRWGGRTGGTAARLDRCLRCAGTFACGAPARTFCPPCAQHQGIGRALKLPHMHDISPQWPWDRSYSPGSLI